MFTPGMIANCLESLLAVNDLHPRRILDCFFKIIADVLASNAPDQQTARIRAFIEVLTLADD